MSSINTWFPGQLVDQADMLTTNKAYLDTLQGANELSGAVFGVLPTVTGATFSVTQGFAFFGETSDTTYISKTGSNMVYAVVPSAGSLVCVSDNCYIYVKYTITYSGDNKTATVTPTVYSSTNASDVGIKICDVVSGVATNFNNNNIRDYFSFSNNTMFFKSPIDNGINLTSNQGKISFIYTIGNKQFSIAMDENNAYLHGKAVTQNNNGYVLANTDGTNGFAILTADTDGVSQYNITVANNGRPTLYQKVYSNPTGSEIISAQDFDLTTGANGQMILPIAGIKVIVKWGHVSNAGVTTNFYDYPFPTAFPNQCYCSVFSGAFAEGTNTYPCYAITENPTTMRIGNPVVSATPPGGTYNITGTYFAIGF